MRSFHVGESVVVKPGVLDPDFGVDVSGWQGRIEEVDDGDTVLIRWDSITLKKMNMNVIIRCEKENLNWEIMTLDKKDVEVSKERDSTADVDRTAAQLKIAIISDPRIDTEQ